MKSILLSIRSLRRASGFSVAVILTLALGIGASTASFSLLQTFLFESHPLPDPQELVRIRMASSLVKGSHDENSLRDIRDWRDQSKTLSDIGGFSADRMSLISESGAVPIQFAWVTPEFFAAVGVEPALGRGFLPDEDRPGGPVRKAVISHQVWRDWFSSDPNVLGKTVQTSMDTLEVVGVMPEGFTYPHQLALWTPFQTIFDLRGWERAKDRGARWVDVVARLAPGATFDEASAEMLLIGRRLQQEHPETNGELLPEVLPLEELEVGGLRVYLFLLASAAGVLLLICCSNAAHLIVIRTASRQRELAVRSALGAGRARLAGFLFWESILLSAAAGLLGAALAAITVRFVPLQIPISMPAWVDFKLDSAAVGFTLLLVLLTAMAFSLAPAGIWRAAPARSLHQGGRSGTRGGNRLRGLLATTQVAMSTVLLIAAGLMLKTLDHLQQADPGFVSERVLAFEITPFRPGSRNEHIPATADFIRKLNSRLLELPEVAAVGGTDNFPYQEATAARQFGRFEVQGEEESLSSHRGPTELIDVTPGYFEVLQIPVFEGRPFDEGDTLDSEKVVILSRRTADKLFGNRPPLGQKVRYAYESGGADPWATVVGIVGNVKYAKNEGEEGIEVYFPHSQWGLSTPMLAVRLHGPAPGIEDRVREVLAEVDPSTAVNRILPLQSLLDDSIWRQRVWGHALSAFSVMALLLAALGLFAVLSYSVRMRRREIGIHMALGANNRDILLRSIVRGLSPAVLGVALGAVASLAVGRLFSSLLFGVGSADPSVFIAVSAAQIAVAVAACWLPASRASRLEPVRVLRQE